MTFFDVKAKGSILRHSGSVLNLGMSFGSSSQEKRPLKQYINNKNTPPNGDGNKI